MQTIDVLHSETKRLETLALTPNASTHVIQQGKAANWAYSAAIIANWMFGERRARTVFFYCLECSESEACEAFKYWSNQWNKAGQPTNC